MKLAVVGSRTFADVRLLWQVLDSISFDSIISGGARGADRLAESYARAHHIPCQVVWPDWDLYGKAAGVIRNREIIGQCDVCVAFWDGYSRGTLNDIELCRLLNKPCKVIYF